MFFDVIIYMTFITVYSCLLRFTIISHKFVVVFNTTSSFPETDAGLAYLCPSPGLAEVGVAWHIESSLIFGAHEAHPM